VIRHDSPAGTPSRARRKRSHSLDGSERTTPRGLGAQRAGILSLHAVVAVNDPDAGNRGAGRRQGHFFTLSHRYRPTSMRERAAGRLERVAIARVNEARSRVTRCAGEWPGLPQAARTAEAALLLRSASHPVRGLHEVYEEALAGLANLVAFAGESRAARQRRRPSSSPLISMQNTLVTALGADPGDGTRRPRSRYGRWRLVRPTSRLQPSPPRTTCA
jgi:hypothetical protein